MMREINRLPIESIGVRMPLKVNEESIISHQLYEQNNLLYQKLCNT